MGSDGRSLGRSSDSGGSSELNPSSPNGPPDKLVTLYDSLAAELREKLNGGKGKHPPLLLPREITTPFIALKATCRTSISEGLSILQLLESKRTMDRIRAVGSDLRMTLQVRLDLRIMKRRLR